jgi:HAD superfamily hydrolase (TIGR01509 family)
MSIATIVLDFGNVVGLFSHRQAAEQLAAYGPGPAAAAEMQAFIFGGPLGVDYEVGRVSSDDFVRHVCQTFRLACTPEEFAVAYSDMFAPNPDVCALLPRLKPRHKLILLSNTCDLHARHFRAQFAEHFRWFDHAVLSHEVGLRKPWPGVYEHCRVLAGSRPDECVFIDDIAENVEGARACGWHGIVYRPGDDLAAKLTQLGVVIQPEAQARAERGRVS